MKEEFETYFKPSRSDIVIKDKPDAYNGFVLVRRYKITIELIDEPVEAIQNRLYDLYSKETSWHNKESILKYCSKNGFKKPTK